ncbi:MAG: hypothetical protein KAI86_17045 [Desulfobacterales bacterium]|nr:hypothetical protein [Desulfobacterales bacterium]
MGNLDTQRQELQQKHDKALVAAVEFELVGAIAHAGGVLVGLSVRYSEVDCLMTLRADLPAGRRIAFVGGASLADCFRRAVNEAYRDKLSWKVGQYEKK